MEKDHCDIDPHYKHTFYVHYLHSRYIGETGASSASGHVRHMVNFDKKDTSVLSTGNRIVTSFVTILLSPVSWKS